jgi:ArsR family transcriptional regulator, nickel/cobalt-responsive transcriptional repressor
MYSAANKIEADWIAAIGEPTRLAVLRALVIQDRTVTELATICQVEMVNMSHHLGVMKTAGLVDVKQVGRCRVYSLIGAKATATELEITHESGVKVILPLA